MVDPQATCELGFTREDLDKIFGTGELDYKDFWFWMRGQTGSVCDGRLYNHETDEYEETGCGPHGRIVYAWDLHRYLTLRHFHDHPA